MDISLTGGVSASASASGGSATLSIGNTVLSGNPNSVLYIGSTGLLAQSSGFTFDGTTLLATQYAAYSASAQPYYYFYPQNDPTKFGRIFHDGTNASLYTNSGDWRFYNQIMAIDVVSAGSFPDNPWFVGFATTALGSGNFSVFQATIQKSQVAVATCNAFFGDIQGNYVWCGHANLSGDQNWGWVVGAHGTNGKGFVGVSDTSTSNVTAGFYQNVTASNNIMELRGNEHPYTGVGANTFTGYMWAAYLTNSFIGGFDYQGALTLGASTGIKLSAATGVLTIASIGNSNNENIRFDLESVSNTLTLTSGTSVGSITWGNVTLRNSSNSSAGLVQASGTGSAAGNLIGGSFSTGNNSSTGVAIGVSGSCTASGAGTGVTAYGGTFTGLRNTNTDGNTATCMGVRGIAQYNATGVQTDAFGVYGIVQKITSASGVILDAYSIYGDLPTAAGGGSILRGWAAGFNGNVKIMSGLHFGPTTGACRMLFDTAETNDTMKIGLVLNHVSSGDGTLLLCEFDDLGVNLSVPLETNPTFRIHAADATDTSKWQKFQHNGTNPINQWGKGNLTFLDPSANEVLILPSVPSAVNQISVTNAPTGFGPTIAASGDDSNINVNVNPRGEGALVVNTSSTHKQSQITAGLIVNFSQSNTTGDDMIARSANQSIMFKVDAVNDRVGIGKTPAYFFEVDGVTAVKAGSSSTVAKVGGIIFDHTEDKGNVTTLETDLYANSIAASMLGASGDKIEAKYGGIFVNSTSTKQLKAYFGGTAILDTGALTVSASTSWEMEILLMRETSSVVRCTAKLNTSGASTASYANYTRITGLTLSSANLLKITGTSAGVGVASDDIVAKLGYGEWKPAV